MKKIDCPPWGIVCNGLFDEQVVFLNEWFKKNVEPVNKQIEKADPELDMSKAEAYERLMDLYMKLVRKHLKLRVDNGMDYADGDIDF